MATATANVCLAITLMIVAAGCGRSGGDSAPSGPTVTPAAAVPTVPQARFAQPTTMIQAPAAVAASEAVTASETVTESASISDTVETTATATVVPTSAQTSTPVAVAGGDFTRGINAYANRGCAECHGAQGEGVVGKGAALAGTNLSESNFTDGVRTGGKGTLGPAHIYGPNSISPGALSSMYAWLASLGD